LYALSFCALTGVNSKAKARKEIILKTLIVLVKCKDSMSTDETIFMPFLVLIGLIFYLLGYFTGQNSINSRPGFMKRKIRMGMIGGGRGAFIGAVHRMAAAWMARSSWSVEPLAVTRRYPGSAGMTSTFLLNAVMVIIPR
jgi:hypothetical protein